MKKKMIWMLTSCRASLRSAKRASSFCARSIAAFAAILVVCGAMKAQAQVKYCMTYTEYTNGQWTTADTAWAETISAASRRIVQSSDYKMKSTDEALEKKLNKEAFAVVTGDGLYVNCRNFRHQGVRFGSGYARGFRMTDGKLCVVNRKVGKSTLLEAGLTGGITSALAPGVIASAIAGTGLTEVQLANQVCYLVDSDAGSNGKTKITQIGDQVISTLLADRKDLLDKYNAAGDKRTRQSALNVLSILREAGLLE